MRGIEITSEVPGVMERIGVRSGAAVAEGDLLVRLSSDVDRAELRRIEVPLDNARKDLARNRELLERGVIAEAAFDESQTNVRNLVAQVSEHAT